MTDGNVTGVLDNVNDVVANFTVSPINKVLINGDIGGVSNIGVEVDRLVVGPAEKDILPSVVVMPMTVSCANNESVLEVIGTDACMTNSIASPIESPIPNSDSVEHVDCETSSPLVGLVSVVPKENVDATFGLDDQHLAIVGTSVDNNAEVPSSNASIELVSNVVSTGCLGPIVNVSFVDVPITLIFSKELENQLVFKFTMSFVDHSDWLDGSCSSPCRDVEDDLVESEDNFHEYSLNVSRCAQKVQFHGAGKRCKHKLKKK
ncbi:hypothetical protein IEQ34_004445 [Dendrobium chrysotoxum]|uniref:Uncharacterized protein n=1 Tax=Dendrobium chrysotoxum TaxID=161865 RepID=A0AAV7HH49_DENCH|nr:hypothetical protein IEQ34_004445 [Dendrobium chrysotoxum]